MNGELWRGLTIKTITMGGFMTNQRPHKNLTVWQKALLLVKRIYEITKHFPKEEEFGLKSQLRRASVSVPSNIAEGLTRRSRNDKLHFLNTADASLSEIDTQLEISLMLGFLDQTNFDETEESLIAVEQLLGGLKRSIARQ